ncbi:MAG: sulfatase-like hydrolase/transferase [Planctomycetales bacterium]|nr:sulfatase-like hydrolase/transferase [Planctomycetales bacterium]
MIRAQFRMSVASLVWAGCLFTLGALSAAERPNVVWILSEDNSVHYLRHYGAPFGAMPVVERMAAEGITFNHAFSCAPVCSVARTTLMSGMLAPRVGFQYHRRAKPAHLPAGAELFPAYLRTAGYYTTNNRKKDYNVVEGTVWDASSGAAHWRNRPQPATPFFHMQTTTVSHESSLHFAKAEMKREGALSTPASQVQLSPVHPDTPTFRFTHARYFDRVKLADDEVGKIVRQLEQDGLLADTFVFYFGDHGGVLPGSKGYLFERGLHVPLVVRIPENWRDRVSLPTGSRTDGFVSFIDFGPTVLSLCGVPIPGAMDGKPFLGPNVDARELHARDETFAYADRFDEKYDFCRSLRKGKLKYIRNYQAYYPHALQNNYRYKQLAYLEWRELFREGKLNPSQARFFLPKPVEELYDVEADPYETRNLAEDPAYREQLLGLRKRLQSRVKQIHDLSFLPESTMVAKALQDGVAYGREHAGSIDRYVDTVDLALLPYDEARKPLEAALRDDDALVRHWALVACNCFGESARDQRQRAVELTKDADNMVRVRAAEFLGILGEDCRATIRDVLATTEDPIEALLALNTVVYLQDHPVAGRGQIDFSLSAEDVKTRRDELVQRRLEYLTGKLK